MAVTRISRIALTTADPGALETFYRSALGFERIEAESCSGERLEWRTTGHAAAGAPSEAPPQDAAPMQGGAAHTLALSLGRQILELVAFSEPGAPYPRDSASNDPRFQHFAIVVSSMEAAYARLRACRDWTPITSPAPQRLPESSGGVVALKFRDPEGHPLELLEFPAGRLPAAWQAAQRRSPREPCLGIDHSAIVVADTQRSSAFYERLLGFTPLGRSLNRGPEQERLDALPRAVVEVTALGAQAGEPPHLELLCYRSPVSRVALPQLPASHDIVRTRLVLEVDELSSVMARLAAAGVPLTAVGVQYAQAAARIAPAGARLPASGVRPVARGAPLREERPAAALLDPDGHALLLCERAV